MFIEMLKNWKKGINKGKVYDELMKNKAKSYKKEKYCYLLFEWFLN